jgi:DNA-binding CsgD family transcriptional regulator
MGSQMLGVYDEEAIASISGSMASAIEAATFGTCLWDEVAGVFGRAFPGSWTAIHNMNLAEPSLNSFAGFNIDPHYIRTYAEHFAFVNPWTDAHWSKARSGVVAISEEVSPARLFAKSEFYNDWLAPQGAEAATGVKVNGDQGESVQLLMHFPLSHAETYNRASAEVMMRARGNFLRSIEIGALMRRSTESAAAGAALVERGRCAAFVVDGSRSVRDANQQALDLFASGRPVSVKFDRVRLSSADADDRFAKALTALSRGTPADGSRISFRDADAAWHVSMAALPAEPTPAGILSLLPPHRLVLVFVTDLTANAKVAGDVSALSLTFGLTPAEARLAGRIGLGQSLREAADAEGVTFETARSRLKSIFAKTGADRQAELALMVARLAQ